jgi:Ca2+-binding RTX toxin-like protein
MATRKFISLREDWVRGDAAPDVFAFREGRAAHEASDRFVHGAAAPQILSGGPGPVVGTEGDDSLVGTSDSDVLIGLGGNDTLDGGAGTDVLMGGDGNDVLRDLVNQAVPFNDVLDGGFGDDTYDLRANPIEPHNPRLVDAGGIDTVFSNHAFVLPDGFENLELFEGSSGTGNAVNNVITTHTNEEGSYRVDGADGDDTLVGGAAQDLFLFEAGSGRYGNDRVDGGDNFDTMNFSGARSGIIADMRAGTLSGGGTDGEGTVTYARIEAIHGGAFDDRLVAHDGALWVDPSGTEIFSGPRLNGGGGKDTLLGGAASDSLWGEPGSDRLSGGAGSDFMRGDGGPFHPDGAAGPDQFIFDVAPGIENADRIGDFVSGSDEILLDDAVHAELGGAGRLAADDPRFAATATGAAQDANDRVIYNTTTGDLWHDPDGDGAASAQLVATLIGAPGLTPPDIVII